MLNGENKSKIDRMWDAFWSGGIFYSLRVIEQISFLLFIKRLAHQDEAGQPSGQANQGADLHPGSGSSALVAFPGVRGG